MSLLNGITQSNLSTDVNAALQMQKLCGVTFVPDDNDYVKQFVGRKRYLMPRYQTIVVAAYEKQWDITPVTKGPFALKVSPTDNDYIEWNLAGAGLNGIYDVEQMFIYGTITELSGLNAPHRFGPALLWFDRAEIRSDTDDIIWRTYDYSGFYCRFGLILNLEERGVYLSYVDQFGLTPTYSGFGAAGVPNQLAANQTKSWVLPFFGSPMSFLPPALLSFKNGYTGNLTLRLFLKSTTLMKETALNATDSYNINPVLRIITTQRGSAGISDFEQTLIFLEQDNTWMTCLVLHEIRTSGVQSGGGFLPAFGAGGLFDFVPGIAANAWLSAFFFIVRDRPAVQNASNEYTLIPFFTVAATSNGSNNVFLRGVRDGTQDFINQGSFMIHTVANAIKLRGPLLASQPIWMMCSGDNFTRALDQGVIDGFMPLQTNDIFRFQGGTTGVTTFAATNKIEFYMYVVMQVFADIHRTVGTVVKSQF